MKDALFIVGLIVVIILALKVFLWAFKTVAILAIVAAVGYGIVRTIGIARRYRN